MAWCFVKDRIHLHGMVVKHRDNFIYLYFFFDASVLATSTEVRSGRNTTEIRHIASLIEKCL
jgi:hypothetical protein